MQLFHFSKVTLNRINGIKSLDGSKAAQSNQIPTKVIKENYDIFAPFITENFNMIENSVFPVSLKQADIPAGTRRCSDVRFWLHFGRDVG